MIEILEQKLQALGESDSTNVDQKTLYAKAIEALDIMKKTKNQAASLCWALAYARTSIIIDLPLEACMKVHDLDDFDLKIKFITLFYNEHPIYKDDILITYKPKKCYSDSYWFDCDDFDVRKNILTEAITKLCQ